MDLEAADMTDSAKEMDLEAAKEMETDLVKVTVMGLDLVERKETAKDLDLVTEMEPG